MNIRDLSFLIQVATSNLTMGPVPPPGYTNAAQRLFRRKLIKPIPDGHGYAITTLGKLKVRDLIEAIDG